MLDKKLYEEYSKNIRENLINEREVENLTHDLMNLLIQYYSDKNFDKIEIEVKNAKRFKSALRKCIVDNLSYQIGCFSAIITVFELLIKSHIRKESFHTSMIALYEKSGVKEILEYIYNNPDSQHKKICERTSVKNKSYLSQLLKQLENAGCIERYSIGKRSFFSLSLAGQAFVKERYTPTKHTDYTPTIRKYDFSHSADVYNKNPQYNTLDKYSSKNRITQESKNYDYKEVILCGKN